MTKTKYQVALVDTNAGTIEPAHGNGHTALLWGTEDQARADIRAWSRMYRTGDHLQLVVTRIDYTVVPGSEHTTAGHPLPGATESESPMDNLTTPLAQQDLPTGGLALLFVCDGENPGQPDTTRTITVTDLTAVTQNGPPTCAQFDCDNQDEDLRFIGYLPDDDPRLDTI